MMWGACSANHRGECTCTVVWADGRARPPPPTLIYTHFIWSMPGE